MRKTVSTGLIGFLAAIGMAAGSLAATTATVNVDVDKPGIAIPPNFYGLMTEEINHAYDGGLYAELIQNRTFQDPNIDRAGRPVPGLVDPPLHWSLVRGFAAAGINHSGAGARMSIDTAEPVNPALPISLRLDLDGGSAGVANGGYWGIPVRPLTRYTASFYAKGSGGFAGPITAALTSDQGIDIWGKAATQPITTNWKKYTVTLTSGPDSPVTAKARFVLSATGTGSVEFSMVSLFPPTYMNQPNGLRPDLMELMAAMQPAFLRMPGGNYLEGDTFPTRFNWKQMIGPVDQRPGHMGCWRYRSSDGFGLPDYLTWCEDLHMEPVLAVFAGYTLNHDYVPAGPKLQPYVDEALQEIEYCTGSTDTEWGKRRADDGHPKPFMIRYVEIGNEDTFDRSGSYNGRFAQFYDAIKAKYPQIQLIATTPVKSRHPDVLDEHFYRSARRLESDWTHYDKYDRNGPKIFCGEWATQEGRPTPDLNAALADAAWLMGLERNCDLVVMESYAPLLVNVNPGASQWPTNLIGYDALTSFGSPSYWMQVMFGQNRGDVLLPTRLEVPQTLAATEPTPHGAVGVGTWHTNAQYKDIVVTAPDGSILLKADLSKDTSGWKISGGKWTTADSAIKQSSANATTTAIIGDPAWTDYTFTCKAKKDSGREGFLLLFHAQDENHLIWWNIGGWGNTAAGFEGTYDFDRSAVGSRVPMTIDTGRWYDLKVEVQGHHFRGYIDGKLVNDAIEQPVPVFTPLFASASYIKASQEVVLKLVNASSDTVDTAIDLTGASTISPDGKAILLTGESPNDVNTVQQPQKIAPQQSPLTDASASFHRHVPPYSITLLRIKAVPQ